MSFFTNKMDWKSSKRYTPLLLLLSLSVSGFWWGKYASKVEALEACHKWQKKGNNVTYTRQIGEFERWSYEYELKQGMRKPNPDMNLNNNTFKTGSISRHCEWEDETRQYLGYENDAIQNGTYDFDKGIVGVDTLQKHFRY